MTGNKRVRGTYICSFCGKNQDEVQRLIAGPGDVYICDECIAKISQHPEASSTGVEAEASDSYGKKPVKGRCSFCGKKQGQVKYLAQGPGAVNICNECVELCLEIIEEEQDILRKATDAGQNGGQKTQQ